MITLEVHNDGTGTHEIGNYDYRVLVNGKEIANGRVEKYQRVYPWFMLMARCVEDGYDKCLKYCEKIMQEPKTNDIDAERI